MITTKQIGTVVMIVMALLAVASQGAIHLPLGVPESWGPYIQSWSSFIMAIYLVVNPYLPASTFGPLTPPPNEKMLTKDTAVIAPAGTVVSQETGKGSSMIKSLIILGLLIGSFISAPHAHAKGLPNPLTPFTAPNAPVAGSIQTITVDDLKNALADANAQTSPLPTCVAGQPDPASGCMPVPYDATITAGSDTRHGNCWAVLVQFATAFKASQLLPDHPGLALLQQKIFDAKSMTTKNLIPDYVAHQCVDTFNDANKNLADIINALGIKAAAIPKF